MDDLFPLLLFLIFILAPLIESIRKKGQPPKQPPARRPPMQRPMPAPPRSETEEVSGRQPEQAATMIPDDLWQILTGERRPPVLQEPVPRREQPWDVVYIPPEEMAGAEEEAAEAAAAEETATASTGVSERLDVQVRRMRREEAELQARRRRVAPETLEQVPVVKSLETEPLAEEARHTAFHDKLAGRQKRPAVKRAKRAVLGLESRADLQRALVLREVLGRPRGLE